MAQLAAKHRFS
jgi:hypothetical protein